MSQPELTIGQAAAAAGVTRKAVRVYEAKGLLAAAERTAAGYRLYDDHDVELLQFVRRARALSLHLDDIGEILAIRAGGTRPCATVRQLLDTRIAEIDAAVADLLALRTALAETKTTADVGAGDDDTTAVCAIIEEAAPQRL